MSNSGFGLSRNRARPSAPVDGESIKGGNLFIKSLSIPAEVGAENQFAISVEVANGANFISPGDSNHCSQSFLGGVGYDIDVTADPGFAQPQTTERCHGTTESGTADFTYEFDFIAPNPQSTTTYNVYITLATPESDQSLRLRRTVTVLSATATECVGDGDCPAGEMCENGTCVPRDTNGDNGDNGGNGGGCTSNAGCPGNQVCQNGTCVDPDDDDDPSGGLFGLSQTEMFAGAGLLVGVGLLINNERSDNSGRTSRSRSSRRRREKN